MARATVCVAFGAPSQLQDALDRDVAPLLARASDEGLQAEVVIVGGGCIGSFDNSTQLTTFIQSLDNGLGALGAPVSDDGTERGVATLISSFSDLPMLRFYPSIGLGELCRVEDATLGELVDVLRRVPAILDIANVPSEAYRTHIQDCEQAASYFLAMVKREPDVDLKPLFNLAMFAKAVSLAYKTAGIKIKRVKSIIASVPDAEALGLMATLPADGEAAAPSILSFLGCHLVDEDARPGELREPAVVDAAAQALERVFQHSERVHAVLKRSKLATMVHGQAPLVDAGPKDAFLKIIYARKIEAMRATAAGFELQTSVSKTWVQNVNDDLDSVLFALEQPSGGDSARAFRAVAKRVAPKLAALTSVVSPLFTIDSAQLAASMADVLLANRKFSLVAHSSTYAAHIVNQLQIKACAIDVNSCAIHVGKAAGAQSSVVSVFPQKSNGAPAPASTFAPAATPATTSATIAASLEAGDAVAFHKKLQQAAASLDRPGSPIGSLTGTITGAFAFDGSQKRAVIWRKRGGAEVMVTVHDAGVLELKFLDYYNGSLDGSSVGINKIEEEFDIKSKTRLRLITLDPASGVFLLNLNQSGSTGSVEFDLEETPSDRLSGVGVQWARKGSYWVLMSDNSRNERLVV